MGIWLSVALTVPLVALGVGLYTLWRGDDDAFHGLGWLVRPPTTK